MKQISLITRLATLVAIVLGSLLTFSGGLMLMNARADWAVGVGVVVTIAAVLGGSVMAYSWIKEDDRA